MSTGIPDVSPRGEHRKIEPELWEKSIWLLFTAPQPEKTAASRSMTWRSVTEDGDSRSGLSLLHTQGREDHHYPTGGTGRGTCQGIQRTLHRHLLRRRAGLQRTTQRHPDRMAKTFDAGTGESIAEGVSRKQGMRTQGSESGPERKRRDRTRRVDQGMPVLWGKRGKLLNSPQTSPQSTRSTQSFIANERSSPQITRIITDWEIDKSVLICGEVCGISMALTR